MRTTMSVQAVSLGLMLCLAVGVGRTHAQSPGRAECPPNASVRVTPPDAGDKDSTIKPAVSPGGSIKDPSTGNADAFHLDYFVDTDPSTLKPGDVVPAGNPAIIHSGAEKIDLGLASGAHQVWAVLSGPNHVPCRTSDGKLAMGSTQFSV